MDEIMKIKMEMVSLGWDIQEKISGDGWRNSTGYTIWFKRSDWHGKFTYTLTGKEVSIWGMTKDASNYEDVLQTVKDTAEKAKGAWIDFPDTVPCLNAYGHVVKDIMLYSFEEGKDIKKTDSKNKKRFNEVLQFEEKEQEI